jgi:CheY-like chemotaxis protein
MHMAHILVVDDDDQMRRYLSIFLKNRGHSVLETADGHEAVRAVREEAFDLVITDIAMPGMDGLDLIREVRQRQPAAKILAISGAAWDEPNLPLNLARHFGADSTLIKPFGPARFKDAVASLLTSQGLPCQPRPGHTSPRPASHAFGHTRYRSPRPAMEN